MSHIHPTALIDPAATLGENVKIGPFCTVGPHVTLGAGVELVSHVVVDGHTSIGAGSVVYPFAAIGCPPQDLKYKGEPSRLEIGENCRIREHVTMHPGTETGGMLTKVGARGLFMVGVHVAHDCQIGDDVIMANNATLGGHVQVGNRVLIGGLSAVHQFVRIGDYAVIGGMSGVESDVIPFGRVKGERAFLAGLNLIGLERADFERDEVRKLQKAVNDLFGEAGTLDERIDGLTQAHGDDPLVTRIVTFAKGRERFPLCAPKGKA